MWSIRRVNKSLLAFALLFCLSACVSRPDYVIDEETMTELLTDIHMSEGLLEVQQNQLRESQDYGQEIMAAVYLKHGVTRAQYDTSLVWYSQNLKKLIRIYEDVNKNLEAREAEWEEMANQAKQFAVSMQGDSIDLWALSRKMLIDNKRLTAENYWTIPADSFFLPGDRIEWRMHIPDMPKSQCAIASLSLTKKGKPVEYATIIDGATSGPLNTDTMITVSCTAPKETDIYEVHATFHLLNIGSNHECVLTPILVDSLQLLRIHPEK